MKKLKLSSTLNYVASVLFYVAAILFYVAAIITFINGNNNSTGIIWLCLGSANLCLGSVFLIKSKGSDNNTEDK